MKFISNYINYKFSLIEKARINRYLSKVIDNKSSILEVGCGNGKYYFPFLCDFNGYYYGLDIDKEKIKKARNLYSFKKNINFELRDMRTLDEDTLKGFNIVIIHGVFPLWEESIWEKRFKDFYKEFYKNPKRVINFFRTSIINEREFLKGNNSKNFIKNFLKSTKKGKVYFVPNWFSPNTPESLSLKEYFQFKLRIRYVKDIMSLIYNDDTNISFDYDKKLHLFVFTLKK